MSSNADSDFVPKFSGRDDCEISFNEWLVKATIHAKKQGFYQAFIDDWEKSGISGSKTWEETKTKEEKDRHAGLNDDAIHFLLGRLTFAAFFHVTLKSTTNTKIMWDSLLAKSRPSESDDFLDIEAALINITMPPNQDPQVLFNRMKRLNTCLHEHKAGCTKHLLVQLFLHCLPDTYRGLKSTVKYNEMKNKTTSQIIGAFHDLWCDLYPPKPTDHTDTYHQTPHDAYATDNHPAWSAPSPEQRLQNMQNHGPHPAPYGPCYPSNTYYQHQPPAYLNPPRPTEAPVPATTPDGPPPQEYCYEVRHCEFCGGRHQTSACHKKMRAEGRCFQCGEFGHNANTPNCPKFDPNGPPPTYYGSYHVPHSYPAYGQCPAYPPHSHGPPTSYYQAPTNQHGNYPTNTYSGPPPNNHYPSQPNYPDAGTKFHANYQGTAPPRTPAGTSNMTPRPANNNANDNTVHSVLACGCWQFLLPML